MAVLKSMKFRNERRGSVLVETALVFPILLLLTLGLLEYGWMFIKVQQIGLAAREGVRVGARADGTSALCNTAVDVAMTNGHMQSSGYTITRTPDNLGSAAAGSTIKVKVQVNYSNIKLIPGLSTFLPKPSTLQGEFSMMKEGIINTSGGGSGP